jgi:hypothetical protein
MPKSARFATVKGNSNIIKKNTTRRSRHVRGMKNRAMLDEVEWMKRQLMCDDSCVKLRPQLSSDGKTMWG